jgi:hypothetical protein
MCAQTLRCTANDNRNCRAISLAQDSLARTLRDGTYAHAKEDLAVKWNRKVGGEGKEMRVHTREAPREASRITGKIAHRTPFQFGLSMVDQE